MRVLETSVRLDVEGHDRLAVGCVERLLIETELHTIDVLQVLTRLRQCSLWRDVEEQRFAVWRRRPKGGLRIRNRIGEINAVLPIDHQIVGADERLTLERVSECGRCGRQHRYAWLARLSGNQ